MVAESKNVRGSVIAGNWYPGSREALQKQLEGFFAKAEKNKDGVPKAIISPHAGYAYSGQVAAYGFKQLEGGSYERVIVLAPSHHYPLRGVSIPEYTHYRTPLGDVKVSPLSMEIRAESKFCGFFPEAHSREHSLEIELPFLQYSLKDFELVPIIVGSLSESEMDDFAALLARHLDEKTLIVASTDLSHFHPYEEAVSLDTYCIDAITSMDLARASGCEMCGQYPVLVLMRIAKKMGWHPRLFKYMNSGDVTGDRSGVVGYAAIGFYEKEPEGFSIEQKKYLLETARDAIGLYVREHKKLEPSTDDSLLKEKRGVFVTLQKKGQLRGCIGHLEAIQPLYLGVRDNALNAAFRDPRFPALKADELGDVELEISVLTPPELIDASSPGEYLEAIQAGVDGLILEYAGRGATYLPQVWDMLPEKELFLSSLCEKAGLHGDSWKKKGAKLYKYKALVFKESELD